MKYKSSKELTKPKRCWVLRDTNNAAGYIYSPFQAATWKLGIEQSIPRNRLCKKIKDMEENCEVTNQVFHAFRTKKQAREAQRLMPERSLFKAEGSGTEVKGILYGFDHNMDGQPCAGYTTLKLTELIREKRKGQ